MSRWGKNIVVPLDSLSKEKENTNRPTVARSVGTVGKWGKMGFTSTRTYTLSGLPAAVAAAAAAAAAAASPGQSPASALDDDMSPSAPEPPKPKKFFKSRNAAPPEVIAQIIQHLPRAPTSPIGDAGAGATPGYLMAPVHGREPIKLKIAKNNSVERKKKSTKRAAKSLKAAVAAVAAAVVGGTENAEDVTILKPVESKSKKKKEEKKLKPEAPPSRIISRARKTVNYCEDDDEDRMPTPIKDLIITKDKPSITLEAETQATTISADINSENTAPAAGSPVNNKPELPPPAALPLSTSLSSVPVISNAGPTPSISAVNITPKTPEHPPIVLRISKGTSRLVSTDSEEQPNNGATSPAQAHDTELAKSRHASTEEVPPAAHANASTTPKIIVKPPNRPSPEPAPTSLLNNDEPPEINYSTVKISPDKPPKERLKLIIKTDVIRNALAAAAAAAAAKAAAAAQKQAAAEAAALSGAEGVERPEKEKKQKSKKHKHLKHAIVEQLVSAHMPTATVVAGSEFKTPSPHLALGLSVAGEREQQQQHNLQHASMARTIISPPALSERDFDSQSSVLGSISSKGNSTPQPLAQTVQEESCVIHSRGSSVITSDLETSQHSSLVAPPSDIESRLESMMMDGEASQKPANLVVEEEPLQEDILAVLRGDESLMANTATVDNGDVNMNDVVAEKIRDKPADKENQETATKRRVTRGRTRGAATKTNYTEEEDVSSPQKTLPIATVAAATTARTTRGRGKTAVAAVAASPPAAEEASLPKRATRRGVKKTDETTTSTMEIDDSPTKLLAVATVAEKTTPSKLVEENSATKQQLVSESPVTRRGRATRNANNNQNHHTNNNSNINKIAANLSAKAGAAEEAKSTSSTSPTISSTTATTPPTTTPRSYGRKRKNQQVTQVLQPSAEELEEQQQQHPTPAKMLHIDLPTHNEATSAATPSPSTNYDQRQQHTPNLDLHDTNSNNSNSLTRPPSTTNSSPPRRDYKVKDKFKRTLTLDSQVNCNAVIASPTASASDEMCLVATCVAGPNEGNEEKQRGSVKLVISKKKGSIFKSRALGSADPSEQTAAAKRHLYKHRWDAEASGEQANDAAAHKPVDTPEPTTSSARNPAAAVAAIFDDFDDDAETNTNSRDAVPAFKANPFRVGNVKSAHEMQEMGETLELDDNVRYVMDALQPSNATPTRCLSAVRLAKECMKHDFRMHVRAHGVVNKFYRVLADAHQYASLGLCTAAIMYILSQEGLSNDLDRDSFALMMNLLKADTSAAPSDRACYESNRQKIRVLCEEMSTPGRPSYLNMDSLTASSLAMETLFALTSKCASEWFKEALRELGGLEHFMKLISDSCRPVLEGEVDGGGISKPTTPIAWTQLLLDNIKTVERCMRAMENVTHLNVKNQKYLLKYAEGTCVNTMCTLYCLCDRELVLHPTTDDTTDKHHPGVVMRELLLAVLKVLNTLTYTLNPANPLGAEIVGERVDVIETSFYLLLQAPNYIPDRCVFDMSILVLNLLNNLAMHSKSSRALIMKTYAPPGYSSHQQNKVTAVQAVIEYFYKCEEMARLVDEDTDANLEKTAKTKKRQEAVDENALILLQGADRHMEHTLKGSYAGLLIGHLIKDSEENEAIMRTHLPVVGFKDIVSILEKYYKFMVLTGNTEASFVGHMKSTQDVIDYFRKRDLIYEMNDNALPLNLETHHAGDTNNSGSTTALAATGDDAPSTSRAAITRSAAPRVYKTYSQR